MTETARGYPMKKTGNVLENYSCLAKTDRGYPTSIAGCRIASMKGK